MKFRDFLSLKSFGNSYTMFITNNYTSSHLWWKGIWVKYQIASKYYVHDCSNEFHWENNILSNAKHFIYRKTLIAISYATFKPNLHYFSFVCVQNANSIKRLFMVQMKFTEITYIFTFSAHTSYLFKESSVLS